MSLRPFARIGWMLLVCFAGTLASGQEPLVERERRLGVMGTELLITVQGTDPVALDAAIEAAIAEMRRVEDLMTDWRPSPLTRLNDAAGKGPQVTEAELAAIIGRGQAVGILTGGAFDITYGAVGKLWDFKKTPPVVPEAPAIQAALEFVGATRIQVDPKASTVELPAGFCLGLGGIAKGYGVDRAMTVLMEHGVKHGIVNAGGDLKVLGKQAGAPWEVAIKHPRDRQRAMAVLRVSNTCVVTSGDYERFFEKDGRRYHHILDPRTGYPATGCMSATVVAQNAEYADALATALCVLGPEKGLALVERLDRVEAIVVDLEGKVQASPALRSSLQ